MRLSEAPTVDPTARVTGTTLGRYTEIAAHTAIAESTLGDYSYIMETATCSTRTWRSSCRSPLRCG